MSNDAFIVRVRFIGGPPAAFRDLVARDAVYLGGRRSWCRREQARRFRSVAAAEDAVQESWDRLRRAGAAEAILEVEPVGRHWH